MVSDLAGNHRHGAAARADVKRRGPGPEGVLRHQRGITNTDREPGLWARSPDAAVLDAERTTARARRNLWRVSLPFELERDIAAVAFTGDEHVGVDGSSASYVAHHSRAPSARVGGHVAVSWLSLSTLPITGSE